MMTAHPRSLLSLPQADLERALIARASRAIRIEVKAGARLLIEQQWRIERALRPDVYGPVPASIAGRLQRCEARIDCERQLARSPQAYLHSPVRLLSLREVRLALRYLRRFTRIEVVPMHEVEAA